MQARVVHFEEPPRDEPYGRVALFKDPFGNRWDMIESVMEGHTGPPALVAVRPAGKYDAMCNFTLAEHAESL
ncbi:hypothetical protein [Yoonia sp.]|uniref:hypothetical protein n=1 Tax=Yoonia sp. TaxID=2212373 RepID=UPI003F6A5A7D